MSLAMPRTRPHRHRSGRSKGMSHSLQAACCHASEYSRESRGRVTIPSSTNALVIVSFGATAPCGRPRAARLFHKYQSFTGSLSENHATLVEYSTDRLTFLRARLYSTTCLNYKHPAC